MTVPFPLSVTSVVVEHDGLDQDQSRDSWRSAKLCLMGAITAGLLAGCASTGSSHPAITIPPPGGVATTALEADPSTDTPTPGRGRIVYGLSGPANGLLPSETGCDVSCRQLLWAIADPLVAVSDNGAVVPVLLESLEPADDYFTWILTVRGDVAFHDGSVLDAAALSDHLDRCRFSPLTSAWFAPIGATEASGQTLTLHLEEPWLSFPEMLATHPCSFVVKGTALNPVGTGPYRVAEASIGTEQAQTGHGLRTERFEEYWRGTAGTGEGLPHLDAIEFTVQPDPDDRARLAAGGAIDLYQVDGAAPASAVVTSTLGTDTYSLVFNLDADARATADGAPSMSAVPECRNALASAIERSQFVSDPQREATGPFGPGQIGFVDRLVLESPGDPASLLAGCLGSLGGSASLSMMRTDDEASTRIAASLLDQWNSATEGQIAVTADVVEPDVLAQRALTGDFEVLLWRSNGGIHPESSFPWWHSSSSRPVGEVALNVGRVENAAIDSALKTLRVDDLPLAQQFAAEEITRAFNQTNPTIWLEWTSWSVVADDKLSGFDNQTSPDGVVLAPMVAGAQPLHGLICTANEC